MNELDCIQLETQPHPDAAVIWLHGLGADGNDFVPIAQELDLPSTLRIRFVFPHAPVRPISINQGYRMRGWYDVTSLDVAGRDDAEGIIASSEAVARLCDDLVLAGIRHDRIVLAGFSQGGAIALHCGLRQPRRLAGIMALSCYLPRAAALEHEAAAANRKTPVFMAHGRVDSVVAIEFGRQARKLLEQLDYPVEWRDYPMGHSVCPDEITDIRRWLIELLD
jgi:phospholipase/carboxylesterase